MCVCGACKLQATLQQATFAAGGVDWQNNAAAAQPGRLLVAVISSTQHHHQKLPPTTRHKPKHKRMLHTAHRETNTHKEGTDRTALGRNAAGRLQSLYVTSAAA